MVELIGRNEIESFRKEMEDIGRSMRSSFHHYSSSFRGVSDAGGDVDDELELQWAVIERLPTMQRRKTSLFDDIHSSDGGEDVKRKRVVDVTKLGDLERRVFIEKLIKKTKEDNLRLLQKLKERIDKVGLKLPTVEVRYQNLSVDVECKVVEGKPIPTLWNTITNMFHAMTSITTCKSETINLNILKDVTGVIRPSRMTLLLGPPGCGKTTLLQALAGKLSPSLKVTGEVSYNGYKLNEFVPEKTSTYISQYDMHTSEMTVRETLEFSARCLGVGDRADIMKEVSRREKQAGIIPEPDIDTYMKAISYEGLKRTLQTDYILKIFGLDICADTIVGDAMNRGISGGEKKRLTTGELIIGPAKTLFMDEISTGLDSSTTFQIVTCLQQLTHLTESTILMSLLQPTPETFNLFDDIILMAEGKILYHGPLSNILEFFELCGFKCPPRKGVADFLQEVVSRKDQAKYWYRMDQVYNYVSVDKFIVAFKTFHVGQQLDEVLSEAFNKSESHRDALSFNIYSLIKWELFKACLAREWLLMKRNSFLHVFKSMQLVITALITTTVFLRTRMKIDMVHAELYMGSLFFALIRLTSNGISELSLTVSRLAVFYKQRDFYFYPAWAYSIPATILKVPFSLLDAFLWTALTYYAIGYSPEPERFFYQFLLLFLIHQVSVSMFRFIASIVKNPSVAAVWALFVLLVIFLFGGFVIPQPSLPAWLQWGFWLSPLTYAQIGSSLTEFLAERWQKTSSNTTIGQQALEKRGLNFSSYFYWISIAALLGFWIMFNVGFILALGYSKSPRRSETIISRGKLHMNGQKDLSIEEQIKESPSVGTPKSVAEGEVPGMALPFEPTMISFENVQYFVDTPQKLREHGFPDKRLRLLQDITGAFRPGVLTALMGVSGAGKTTLMDVLSGRKTGGFFEGEIRIGGYSKVQETYARVSGYCEQTDIHSPQITIKESVMYSAWLRLPSQTSIQARSEFVTEVLQMIELDEIKDSLVGIPGVSGISSEQRKRLTIAVELVSNPSIMFMDEPTSGLDARAAAIVMRAVKNIVNTQRTVVCTIHQPSIDIFEAFDEVIHELLTMQKQNKELVKGLSIPPQGSKDLHFPTRFSQNGWEQFKACLWKQHLFYWRSPTYNLVRLTFIIASSLLFAAVLWQKGQKIYDEHDLFNIMGPLYIFFQFIGIANCTSILPFIATERNVVYRERFAGMYSSWAYSLAQVTIEIPYILVQAVLFSTITYPAANFHWSVCKVVWYFYTIFCTLLYFSYFGMLLVSLTSTYQVASVLASFWYTILSLFSGYLIPGPNIPKWWIWCYWTSPVTWSLKGVLTSQYGDIDDEITVYGEKESLSTFLRRYYAYQQDDLGIVAFVLLAFPLVFASAFAYAISKLNFQRR